MEKKIILISIDGMRPDGLMQCNNAHLDELLKKASYTLDAHTVFPSVTLPCHVSLCHSVPPERHGTTTNTYMPQVRPISGLFEQIKFAGGISVMYYGWENLRDVSRPGSLKVAEYINAYMFDNTDTMLTEGAIGCINELKPDFVFLYMVETDQKGGHDNGWMSEGYLRVLNRAIDNVKMVVDEFGDEYTIIVTADHGGHDRSHGTNMAEDMTIPMMFFGPDFCPARELHGISLLDIAPTIAKIMGIPAAPEWEGKSIV